VATSKFEIVFYAQYAITGCGADVELQIVSYATCLSLACFLGN
jgi:hypothetical protein